MLFRKDIDPRCAYCARGSRISDDKVACVKRGIVLPEDRCSAFKYDPLKRVPARMKPKDFSKMDDFDFSL